MIRSLLAAALAATLLLAPAADAATLPPTWKAQDAATGEAALFGVETSRHLSPALATAQQRVLQDLGWGAVQLVPVGRETAVVLGATRSLAEAWALQQELREQAIAEGRVVRLPVNAAGSTPEGIAGPRLPAFRPLPEEQRPAHAELLREIQAVKDRLDTDDSRAVEDMLEAWEKNETWNPLMGPGVLAAARAMIIAGRRPAVILAMVEPVAAGDWGAPPAVRHECAGIAADMRLALGDVRGTFRALQALMRMEDLSAENRALAHLRLAALDAALMARGEEPRPTTASIRARLMDAYYAAPEEALRTRARIALLYLQTLAWDGEWERVRIVGNDYLNRYRGVEGPIDLATILLARSLERDMAWEQAVRLLEQVLSGTISAGNALRVGTREIALKETARLWRDWFNAYRWGTEPGERPPDLLFVDEVAPPPPSRFSR